MIEIQFRYFSYNEVGVDHKYFTVEKEVKNKNNSENGLWAEDKGLSADYWNYRNNKAKLLNYSSDKGKMINKITVSQMDSKAKDYSLEEIRVVGHRGCGENTSNSSHILENTVGSFLKAHKMGAQMVELDVHLTIDQKLVVFHDHKIKDKLIADMTFDQFDKAVNNNNNPKSSYSTLDKILNELPEDLGIYVEIKHESPDRHSYPLNYPNYLVKSTINLLIKYHKRKFMVASFCPFVCALAKAIAPTFKVCFLINDCIYNYVSSSKLEDTIINFLTVNDMDGIVFDSEISTDLLEILLKIPGRYKMIYGPGTNDNKKIQRFKSMGVIGFCTDDLSLYF